jgi:alpha-L-fucosidase 2
VEDAAFLARAAMTGTPRYLAPFQPAALLKIAHYKQRGAVSEYMRSLDIDTAVAALSYAVDGVHYQREYFTSLDLNVLAIRITGDAPVSLIANLNRRPFEEHTGRIDANTTAIWGRCGHDGNQYFGAARALAQDGECRVIGDAITVRDASELVILVAFATDYRGNICYREQVHALLDTASAVAYTALKDRHIQLYQSLYKRVELSINDAAAPEEPTDVLLEQARNGNSADYLTLLEFNMGRYLLISSSYHCRLPANLQGLWNGSFTPPWESVFTININLEMNYWPAELCGLGECHEALFNLIDLIVERGRETARRLYGCRGFVAHHNTDIWGDTAPTGLLDASPYWVMGGAWLALHLFEHYRFTLDTEFLRKRAFPVMEEALLFFRDYLQADENGVLHTGPSVSPENTYITKDGQAAALCMSPAMDIQILRELYQCYDAARVILNENGVLQQELCAMADRLPKTGLTKDGRIREWLEDYDEVEPGHRHISHLFALHPGTQITEKTPALFEAAKKTLAYRLAHGGGHTGWSGAWVINFMARLKDGNGAWKQIQQILTGKTIENMLNVHPPFQIDGNFGFTAGIVEMLVQSHGVSCELLPALPDAWKSGHVKGLRLRGGHELEMAWKDRRLTFARIVSATDSAVSLVIPEPERYTIVRDGNTTLVEVAPSRDSN